MQEAKNRQQISLLLPHAEEAVLLTEIIVCDQFRTVARSRLTEVNFVFNEQGVFKPESTLEMIAQAAAYGSNVNARKTGASSAREGVIAKVNRFEFSSNFHVFPDDTLEIEVSSQKLLNNVHTLSGLVINTRDNNRIGQADCTVMEIIKT